MDEVRDYYMMQAGKVMLVNEIDEFVAETTGLSRNDDKGLSIQFYGKSIEIDGPDTWALQVNLLNAIHSVMNKESRVMRRELFDSMPDEVKRKIELENRFKYPNGIMEAVRADIERENKNG